MPSKTSTALVVATVALVGLGSAAAPAMAGVKWQQQPTTSTSTLAGKAWAMPAGNTWTRTVTVQPAGIAWK